MQVTATFNGDQTEITLTAENDAEKAITGLIVDRTDIEISTRHDTDGYGYHNRGSKISSITLLLKKPRPILVEQPVQP